MAAGNDANNKLVSRPWAERRISSWAADPDGAVMMVVRGDPGAGKSSLLLNYTAGHPQGKVVAQVSRAPGRVDLFDGFGLLGDVIGALTGLGFEDREALDLPASPTSITVHVGHAHAGSEVNGMTMVTQLSSTAGRRPVADRLIRQVPVGEQLLIVVDGLDQAEDEDEAEFLAVIGALQRAARGTGVRLLCTSRRRLPPALDESLTTSLDLTADAPSDDEDLRGYLVSRFMDLGTADRDHAVGTILQGAEGNWLWAATNADSLQADIAELGGLPAQIEMTAGLEGLYEDGIRRIQNKLEKDWAPLGRPILAAVSCSSNEQLSQEELRWITGGKLAQIEDVAVVCEPFLRRSDDFVRLFHPDFGRWILADNVEGITEEEGHLAAARGLAKFGRRMDWSGPAAGIGPRVIEHWCSLLVLDPFSPDFQEHQDELGNVLTDEVWAATARFGLDTIAQIGMMVPTLRFPSTSIPLGVGVRALQTSTSAKLLVGRKLLNGLSKEEIEEFSQIQVPATAMQWLEERVPDYGSVATQVLWTLVVRGSLTIESVDGALRARLLPDGTLQMLEELDVERVALLVEITTDMSDESLRRLIDEVAERAQGSLDAEGKALMSALLGELHEELMKRASTDEEKEESFTKALDAFRQGFGAKAEADGPLINVAIDLANAIRDLPSPSKEDLSELAEAQTEIGRIRRERGESSWTASLRRVGNALVQRAGTQEDEGARLADIHSALALYREAIAETEGDDEAALIEQLVDFANGLGDLIAAKLADEEDINELIAVHAWIADLRMTSASNSYRTQALNRLGHAYGARADLREKNGDEDGAAGDRELRLAYFREAWAVVPIGSDMRLKFAIDYADLLLQLEQRSDSQFEDAIVVQRAIVQMRKDAGNVEGAGVAGQLTGKLLFERSQNRDGDSAATRQDLREAIAAFEEALAMLPEESNERTVLMMGLADAIAALDSRSDGDLDRWVEAQDEVVDAVRDLGDRWPLPARLLGLALIARAHEGSGSREADLREADLRRALEILREARDAADADEEEADCLAGMADALRLLAQRSEEEVDELIEVQQRLAELLRADGGQAWWATENLLGDSFLERYRTRDGARGESDLLKAIEAYRKATTNAPMNNPDWPTYALDLAHALEYLDEPSAEELYERIELQETVLDRLQHEGATDAWPFVANRLGDSYVVSASRTDPPDVAALRRAIVVYSEAVIGIPAGNERENVYCRDLANAYLRLPTYSESDLEELIKVQSRLVDLLRASEDSGWMESAGILGNLYRDLARVRGSALDPAPEEMELALQVDRLVLAADPEDPDLRIAVVIEATNTLRAKDQRSLPELDELVELQTEVVAYRQAEEDPRWTHSSNRLGDALAERAWLRESESARREDLEGALSAYRAALDGLDEDAEDRATFAVNVANTIVLAAKRGGSQALDEAIRVVTQDPRISREDRALSGLFPVIRSALRRRERWAV